MDKVERLISIIMILLKKMLFLQENSHNYLMFPKELFFAIWRH